MSTGYRGPEGHDNDDHGRHGGDHDGRPDDRPDETGDAPHRNVSVDAGGASLSGTSDAPIAVLDDVHVVHRIGGSGPFGRANVYALTGASLAIHRNETIGLVGESGCGKSTLGQVLVGLQKPTRGTVHYGDRDLWGMSARQRQLEVGRHVGMIFQDPSGSLNRRMTVRDILRDPLDVHGVGSRDSRERRVQELMELVGLARSVGTVLPGQLSGGQRQRVSIARALALDPALIVADEPTSALDVSVRAQILNLLFDLKQRLAVAMVFISHDIQTVKRVSDRVVTMYLGRLVEETPAGHLPESARHPYTRALFSATPGLLSPIEPVPLIGPVPSATNPPSGCPFRTRCWRADDICADSMPEHRDGGPADGDTVHGGTDRTDDGAGYRRAGGAAGANAVHRFRCHHPVDAGLSDAEVAAEARAATRTSEREPIPE